jgi:Mrp family chromosome partitioning ATPase
MTDIYDALERAQVERNGIVGLAPPREVDLSALPAGISQSVATVLLDLYHAANSRMEPGRDKLIAFVGPSAGAGASTLACRFTQITASLLRKSVLYVNVNPARSGSGIFPEVSKAGGLSAVIRGTSALEDVVEPAGTDMLHVTSLSLGDLDGVTALLETEAFTDCLNTLRANYDMVVFDPPAFDETTEAIALASKLDGIILVVEAEKTRSPVANTFRKRLEMQGGNILGGILNKRRHHIPGFIYRWL